MTRDDPEEPDRASAGAGGEAADGADGGSPGPASAGGEARDDASRDPGLLAEAVDRMAHQIKNPLQAVAMNLEVIRMRVRAAAPELWSDLERHGDAVDENVSVLDRRLRLLLRLGRRSPGEARESVDVAGLVGDFAEALRIDEERPAMSVASEGPPRAARARPGYVLAFTLDLWRWARDRAPEVRDLPLTVSAGEEDVALVARLPTAAAGSAIGDRRRRWEGTARDAGGRLEVTSGDGTTAIRMVLPAD